MKALLATLCLGFSILVGTFLLPTTNAYGQSKSELSSLSDKDLCFKATQEHRGHRNPMRWHTGYSVRGAVKEAKRRGITVNCRNLLSSDAIFASTDQRVCMFATIGSRWDKSVNNRFVTEARRRGLSCGVRKAVQTTARSSSSNSTTSSSHNSNDLAGWSAKELCRLATVNGRWDDRFPAHVTEAKRRGLSCDVGEPVQTTTRSSSSNSTTPSRSRSNSVAQSSENITFCYDPSQSLAYRTEKPSCDTNDFEITSAEYDRRRGGKSNNTLTTTSRPAAPAPPPPPRHTGNAQWGVYAGSTPPVPVSQALAICGSEARIAGARAARSHVEDNEGVTCRTDYAGNYNCKRGSSGSGFWAGLAAGVSKGLAESRAEESTLQRCMATYSYIAK